eukprot:c14863_g1_i2.p1 GENE.c14863_g1_i2~~c14863_g1_i2.p1  ORF type:complete len:407 (-),score=87.77 c14863_g1_i2:119-1339(-)
MPGLRGSGYYKKVWLGKRTIKDGEVCSIWSRSGRQTVIQGPTRKWVFFSRVTFLDRRSADPSQYLRIHKIDGVIQHKRGPCYTFENPLFEKSVTVCDGLRLSNTEAIIVYSHQAESNAISRRIINGPTMFFPEPNEFLHKFSWHGIKDPTKKTQFVADANQFTKLSLASEKMYFNVHDVRTSDDAMLSIKFMVFYKLVDVDKMLSGSNDPIRDIIGSLTSDTITFVAKRTFEDFVEQNGLLNDLSVFPNTTGQAASMGFRIENIVYRGYQASDNLQAKHDKVIASRSSLKLELENTQQTLELKRRDLEKQIELSSRQHALELAQHESTLSQQRAQHTEAMRLERTSIDAEVEKLRKTHEVELNLFKAYASQQVDLTRLLCAQNEPEPDKLIRVVGSDGVPLKFSLE